MSFLPALPPMPESRLLRQLIGTMNLRTGRREGGLLRMLGVGPIFHDEATNAPRRCPSCRAEIHLPRNEPGFPDVVAIQGDTLWLVELKAERGRLSQPQQAWRTALQGVRRVRYAIWRPSDVDRIPEDLKR